MQSGLKNSYAQDLPELSKKCIPSGFQNSEIILKNYELGEELGFSKKFLDSDKCLNIFSGNALLRDSIPIAQAYSGPVSYTHSPSPRDLSTSRMPSSA